MNEQLPIPVSMPGRYGEILDEARRSIDVPGSRRDMVPASVLLHGLGRMFPYAPTIEISKIVFPYLSDEKYKEWHVSYRGFSQEEGGVVNMKDEEIAPEVRKIMEQMQEQERNEFLARIRAVMGNYPRFYDDFIHGRGNWQDPWEI